VIHKREEKTLLKTSVLTSRTARIAAGVLAAVGLLAVTTPVASAAPASYTCVTANNVRYHAAPDAGSTTYGEVNAGQGFNITDWTTGPLDGRLWDRGNLWGGRSGVYILDAYIGTCR
jgi:hypothetical protein